MAQFEGETLERGAQLGSAAGVSRDEVRGGRGLQPEDGKDDSEKYYLGKSTRFKGREGERCWCRGERDTAGPARPWAVWVTAVKLEALGRCEVFVGEEKLCFKHV